MGFSAVHREDCTNRARVLGREGWEAIGGRESACELLSLRGEVEVLVGEAACVVCGESQAHAVVPDVNVWMVARLLGQFADPVHEVDGGNEVLKLKDFYELAGDDLPV